MKKSTLLFVVMLVVSVLLMTSCYRKQEELFSEGEAVSIGVTHTYAALTPEYLVETSDLIIRGRVISKDGAAMSNPDNTRKATDAAILNALITSYTVEIDEIYKGNYREDTICVKTSYGAGLTPEMILGESKDVAIENDEAKLSLSTEGDCILLLSYIETDAEVDTGYFPTRGAGYLQPDGNGNYSNNDAHNPMTVTPESLAATIASVKENPTQSANASSSGLFG